MASPARTTGPRDNVKIGHRAPRLPPLDQSSKSRIRQVGRVEELYEFIENAGRRAISAA